MPELFTFALAAFFAGILGIIIGGPFRILVVENELIESPLWRAVFGFIFFPPVVGVSIMLIYFLATPNANLDALDWGAIVGLISGMTFSFVISKKAQPENEQDT